MTGLDKSGLDHVVGNRVSLTVFLLRISLSAQSLLS